MNEQLKIIISAETAKFKQNVDSAKKAITDFAKGGKQSLNEFTQEFQKYGDASKKVLAVTAGAIAGAATALLALGNSTKEYRNQQAQLATAFETAGGSATTAKETYNDLYRVLGDGGKATEAAQHLAKLTTEEKALSEWTNICQGVYAQFGESLPIEGLTEAVNHTAKVGEVQGVLADALEWSGVNMDEFNEQLFWCNSESEREKLIRDTLNGIYSESAAAYETNNAAVLAQNEAQAKLTEAMAALGAATAPIMTMLAEFGAEVLAELAPHIQEFADKYLPDIKEALVKVADAVGNVISWVADNWELVSTLAIVIGAISAALSILSTVMGIVNAVMMASPVPWIVLAIVAAIALLVAGIVLVIKYWDEIKESTRSVWEPIAQFLEDIWADIVEVFKAAWEAIKAIWEVVAPYFSVLWEKVKGAFNMAADSLAATFKLVWETIKLTWDNIVSFFKATLKTISTTLSIVKDVFEGNFSAAWEKVKSIFSTWGSYFTGLWEKIKSIFSGISNTMIGKFNTAKDTIKSIVDKIKSLFSFEWSLPKLKVPKFSITPSGWGIGDLLKGVIPKLGITWNARGGVFDKPTLFGYGNSLQGIGENGAEAVVPLENNLEWLNKLADMLTEKMGGNTPIVLNVDGKVFAQTAIRTINQNTRQTGKLALNLV